MVKSGLEKNLETPTDLLFVKLGEEDETSSDGPVRRLKNARDSSLGCVGIVFRT